MRERTTEIEVGDWVRYHDENMDERIEIVTKVAPGKTYTKETGKFWLADNDIEEVRGNAALRRAKADGLKEAEQYALTCLKELQDKICDIELGKYTLVGSQTKEGVAEWVHAKTLQAGRMAKWITARIAEVEADARAAQIEEGE